MPVICLEQDDTSSSFDLGWLDQKTGQVHHLDTDYFPTHACSADGLMFLQYLQCCETQNQLSLMHSKIGMTKNFLRSAANCHEHTCCL